MNVPNKEHKSQEGLELDCPVVASSTPGTNVTLSSMGEGVDRGAGADWDGTRGSEVGVTGLGGVGDPRARWRIEAGCTGSRSGVPFAVIEVGVSFPRADVLGVETEELKNYTTISYASFG